MEERLFLKKQIKIQSLDNICRTEVQEEIERRQEGWRRELITADRSPNYQDELDWLRVQGNKDSTTYMILDVEIEEHRTRSQRYNEEVTKLRRKRGTIQKCRSYQMRGNKTTG